MQAKLRRLMVLAATLAAGGISHAQDDSGAEFFEKQVRPILVARCYECHSGESAKLKGGLRLDSREAAFKGGDTGPAVVAGKPKESLLVDAINYGDVYQMPPKSKLPAEEIAVLTKWVEMGAPWGAEARGQGTGDRGQGGGFDLAKRKAEHWCWQPIRKPEIPEVSSPNFQASSSIDAFVLEKLTAAGLSLSPPAESRVLMRRLYFDLIGLPPKAEEVEEFLSLSPSPLVSPSAQPNKETWGHGDKGKYEAIVDRLLASPRFGERWGRHWLDLVRYAETRGHEFDYTIPNAFEYRDYVIRALNADVPYDEFVVEHIAGDLLVQPRLHPREGYNESIVGTGFWFLGEWCHSPVDIRKDECDRIDNMLDVFSKTFLGVTVACARCHDHKFDAISQQDYYALAGYVKSSSYRLTRFETWEQDRQIAAGLTAIDDSYRPRIAKAIAEALSQRTGELAKRLAASEDQNDVGVAEWDLSGATVVVDYGGAAETDWMVEGPTFGSGPAPAGQLVLDGALPFEVATYGAARRDQGWASISLAATSEVDPGRLSWLRAGRALKTPTFALKSGYVHYLIEGLGQVYAAVDSHALLNGPLHGELTKETGGIRDLPVRWITHDLSRYVGHRVHLEFSPKDDEDFRVLMVVEGAQRPKAPQNRPNRVLPRRDVGEYERAIQETLKLLAGDRIVADSNARDRAALASWLIAQSGIAEQPPRELADLLAEHKRERDKLLEAIRADSRLCLAMWDGTSVDENLLIRGNHKTVGPVAPRRMLEALEGSGFRVQGAGDNRQVTGDRGQESAGSGRLEMARRLVDPSNPLVSRVIVNRVWQHLMGRGIVPTVDNFGVLGQPPTHPELLDHLASGFMADGWSMKRLVKRVVMSGAYRQGSGFGVQGSGDSGQGTGDRGRGAGEIDPQNLLFHRQNIRRLEGEVIRDAILSVSGGLDESMHGPSVPIFLTPFMEGRGRPKVSGSLDGAGRRSIYVAVRRNFLSPMMLAFDTPIPFTTMGRRNESNVPAQALILMNDPFVLEQARTWARKVLSDGRKSTTESRIQSMYLAAYARGPSPVETAAALDFLGRQSREYGLSIAKGNDDQRTWSDLAHTMYNMKEFLFLQ